MAPKWEKALGRVPVCPLLSTPLSSALCPMRWTCGRCINQLPDPQASGWLGWYRASAGDHREGGLCPICTCVLRSSPGRSPGVTEAPVTRPSTQLLCHPFYVGLLPPMALEFWGWSRPILTLPGHCTYLIASLHPAHTFMPSPFMNHSMNYSAGACHLLPD